MPDRADVLAIVGKGGAGKTTSAAALAEQASFGQKVLLVDLDAQASLTDWLASPDRPAGDQGFYGICDAIVGSITPAQAISRVTENLDLLPVGSRMMLAEDHIAGRKRRREDAISDLLEPLRSMYDLIVIDAPKSTLSLLVLCVLEAADHVIVPFVPAGMNVFALKYEVGLIREEEAARGVTLLRGLLPCAVPAPQTIAAADAFRQIGMASRLQALLLPPVRSRTAVERLPQTGLLPTAYKPAHDAAADYRTVMAALTERMMVQTLPVGAW